MTFRTGAGGGAEEVGVSGLALLLAGHIGALTQIVPKVMNRMFLRSLPSFELAEAVVFRLGPAEAETLETLPA